MPWDLASASRPIRGLRLAIAVAAIVVVIGLVWAATTLFSSLDQHLASSAAVRDKVVAAVSADWGRSSFDPLATPDFIAAHAKGKYDVSRYLTLLGALETTKSCAMEGMSIVNSIGWSLWRCPAAFESGEATLVIKLTLGGGKWLLSDFAVQI